MILYLISTEHSDGGASGDGRHQFSPLLIGDGSQAPPHRDPRGRGRQQARVTVLGRAASSEGILTSPFRADTVMKVYLDEH